MASAQAMIAAGIGCRAGCAARDIVLAIERALEASAQAREQLQAVYTAEWKRTEPGLTLAAAAFGAPLIGLPLEQLQAESQLALTYSQHVARRFGVPSIAETAALAGARARCGLATSSPQLLGPRVLIGGASCALALRNPLVTELRS